MAELFPSVVYTLCFLTSSLCAVLLGRMFVRRRSPMLLWSAACFVLLAIANLLVVLDLLVLPEVDLRPPRLIVSFAAVSVLLFGFIWNRDD